MFCFDAQAQEVPRQGDFITINSTIFNAILEAHAEYTKNDPDIGCLDLILSRREAGKFLVSFMPDNRNETEEPEASYPCKSSVTYEFSDDGSLIGVFFTDKGKYFKLRVDIAAAIHCKIELYSLDCAK